MPSLMVDFIRRFKGPFLYRHDPSFNMIFVAGLAVNRTGLKLTDLRNFLTDKNLSHAFRGGIEYVGYHGLNATSMHSFWARYLKMDLEIQNN